MQHRSEVFVLERERVFGAGAGAASDLGSGVAIVKYCDVIDKRFDER